MGNEKDLQEKLALADTVIEEARTVVQLFFNRGGKFSAYCKKLKEALEEYDKK